jgi:cytochrome P450 monooxygenase
MLEMLLLFVPNNDTTSIFVSNVFWNLARYPDVYAKVREEVLSVGEDTPLVYECLKGMKYLEAVLNESE